MTLYCCHYWSLRHTINHGVVVLADSCYLSPFVRWWTLLDDMMLYVYVSVPILMVQTNQSSLVKFNTLLFVISLWYSSRLRLRHCRALFHAHTKIGWGLLTLVAWWLLWRRLLEVLFNISQPTFHLLLASFVLVKGPRPWNLKHLRHRRTKVWLWIASLEWPIAMAVRVYRELLVVRVLLRLWGKAVIDNSVFRGSLDEEEVFLEVHWRGFTLLPNYCWQQVVIYLLFWSSIYCFTLCVLFTHLILR